MQYLYIIGKDLTKPWPNLNKILNLRGLTDTFSKWLCVYSISDIKGKALIDCLWTSFPIGTVAHPF